MSPALFDCLKNPNSRIGYPQLSSKGLYIRGMAIVPNARGKRIGVTLLQQAESFGLERGIRRLFLSTTPFLFRAITLYENYGFTKSPSGPHDLFGHTALYFGEIGRVSDPRSRRDIRANSQWNLISAIATEVLRCCRSFGTT